MKFSSLVSLACFALGVFALPKGLDNRAAPTIYLAGDSTMAAKGANNGLTDGKVLLSLLTHLDS
jgi:rhamnogalacturonan acetylesterase